MNQFPNIININIREKSTNEPIDKIAVKIQLYAQRKNDYIFLLPLSNNDGNIEISKNWIEGQIKKEQSIFIMDYASNLDECKSKFSLTILDRLDLQKAIDGMILYQHAFGIEDKEIEGYKQANNEKYDCKKRLDFLTKQGEMKITINLVQI